MMGSVKQEDQASLGKKQDPILKVTTAKKTGGLAQAVGYLPNKYKALSTNPILTGYIE
jgi:hypothetical protein